MTQPPADWPTFHALWMEYRRTMPDYGIPRSVVKALVTVRPINPVDPWDVPPPAETLDERLAQLGEGDICRHCRTLIYPTWVMGESTWKHSTGRWTCDLPKLYYGAEKVPYKFAEPVR